MVGWLEWLKIQPAAFAENHRQTVMKLARPSCKGKPNSCITLDNSCLNSSKRFGSVWQLFWEAVLGGKDHCSSPSACRLGSRVSYAPARLARKDFGLMDERRIMLGPLAFLVSGLE
jgi:hypothetical protein